MKTSRPGRILRAARIPTLWVAACATIATSLPGNGQSDRSTAPARTAYRIDSKTSRLTVETETAGLSSLFGHDHRFDGGDFTGAVALRQSDFKIKPYTFAKGTVKVRDTSRSRSTCSRGGERQPGQEPGRTARPSAVTSTGFGRKMAPSWRAASTASSSA